MKVRAFFNNLQIKVLLLFLLVALMPLGIVAVFSIRTAEELIINMASNQLGNVADDKASLLERWITERKADLKVVAGSSILRSMNPDLIAPYLKLVETHYEVYKGFMVGSSADDIVYNSFGRPYTSAWQVWYQQSMAGKLCLSGISFNPQQEESFFHVSAPIHDENGHTKGAVCALVSTRTILSLILRVSLGETGECYLVDKDGTFLAHKEPRRILAENIAQSGSFRNIFGDRHHRNIYTDYRGIEVLGTSRKIPDTDWYLVVEQDRDEAFRSADRLTWYVLISMVIFGGLATFLAWLLSYYVVHPIQRLSEATKTLARGEFEKALIETHRADEIGVLYLTFADMARQLQARQHNLERRMNLTEAELKETDVMLKKTRLAAARSEQLAALGRLAAGVAHEIRTPLTSLKLFLESAEAEIEISPEYEQDFQVAMRQIERIEATINRFLNFARPQEPIFSCVDVERLIGEALLVVRPRANQQETVVEVAIDHDLPTIQGDRKQLAEALLNLMVNALEAMAGRGRLAIRACSVLNQSDQNPGTCIRIDISDTGPGIDDEYMPRLFEPFFTTKSSGTGLGLSIVYSTIQRHGGEVKVRNVKGAGLTFSILLPVLTGEVAEEYGQSIGC